MEWVEIEGFPMYVVNREGQIKNIRTHQNRHASRTQQGHEKVTLFCDGLPYTRSVALIVAKAFLWNDFNPEIFDTPIHLDNDPTNNHVDNLMWRPRWFALKYTKQYWNLEFRHATPKIQDVTTGIAYGSYIEPCQTFGLLYMDIIQSCTRGIEVFPTRKVFIDL